MLSRTATTIDRFTEYALHFLSETILNIGMQCDHEQGEVQRRRGCVVTLDEMDPDGSMGVE